MVPISTQSSSAELKARDYNCHTIMKIVCVSVSIMAALAAIASYLIGLSLAVTIACAALSCGFAFLFILTCVHAYLRPAERVSRGSNPPEENAVVDPPLASSRLFAGCANGGNTCFIATALQCFNYMYFEYLDKCHEQFEGKTLFFYQLFKKLNQGTPISAVEMRQARLQIFGSSEEKPSDQFRTLCYLMEIFKDYIPTCLRGDLTESELQQMDTHSVKLTDSEVNWIPSISCPLAAEVIANSDGSATIEYFGETSHEGHFKTRIMIREKAAQSKDNRLAFPKKLSLFVNNSVGKSIPIPKTFELIDNDNFLYELVGCSIGGIGHAYAYLKQIDGDGQERWFEFNDSSVKQLSEKEVIEQGERYGTMLLFKCNPNKKPPSQSRLKPKLPTKSAPLKRTIKLTKK
jgi:hypothetical protein